MPTSLHHLEFKEAVRNGELGKVIDRMWTVLHFLRALKNNDLLIHIVWLEWL